MGIEHMAQHKYIGKSRTFAEGNGHRGGVSADDERCGRVVRQ